MAPAPPRTSTTPEGVAVDAAGNLYVADTTNCTIRKLSRTGIVTTFAGTAGRFGLVGGTGAAARFNNPKGVAVDRLGQARPARGAGTW